jgi:hypothetical protein
MIVVLTIIAVILSLIALIDSEVTHRLPGWVQWIFWSATWLLLIAFTVELLDG